MDRAFIASGLRRPAFLGLVGVFRLMVAKPLFRSLSR
jgi:hypothetical protein